jgi:hypothetical protein
MTLTDNTIIAALNRFKNKLLKKVEYYISAHNVDPDAHADIRQAIANSGSSSNLEARVSNLEEEWGEFYEDMAG